MLGKRSSPMIGKITDLLVSGSRSVFSDVATSPRTPLELKIHSPRGFKSYDVTAGVGLGIVAALEKSGDCAVGTEILARFTVPSPRPIRTDPMPVKSGQNCGRARACFKEPEMDSFVRHNKIAGIFSVSPMPARFLEETVTEFQVSDFLSSCHMCSKKLHGKDIYMYRGEKAFCSTDCRERQIAIDDDDRKEQCRSEARRSVDVSRSSYNQGNMFSTGIMAI